MSADSPSFCRPHAFVVMPFGTKPGPEPDGPPIDFNRVYADLIRPALEQAGLDPFRADQEQQAGDIRTDMFQELLLADLVVADLTINNPNVWYELGVRHALRARGVVLICGGRVTLAFDTYTDRKLRYGLRDGVPDPATLAADRDALARMVRDTMTSWTGRRISPVYGLLPHLQEPDWKSLRIGEVRAFWEEHDSWLERLERARSQERIGDMLVLADEAPVAAFRAEAWFEAGDALRRSERYRFAIEQLDRGLAVEPGNLRARRGKGTCLQRLALDPSEPAYSIDRALAYGNGLLKHHPHDADTWALAGRLYKDAWCAAWQDAPEPPEQQRQAATDAGDSLQLAIRHYLQGFRLAPANHYPGINALTLMHLAAHLQPDPAGEAERTTVAGAVRFAAESAAAGGRDQWALATLADLELLTGTVAATSAAYRRLVAQRPMDRFTLESCRTQLELLRRLQFQPEPVEAALSILEAAIARLPQTRRRPRLALLFSGHMIDAPGRPEPRFPPSLEQAAAERIRAELQKLGAGPDDLAFCQAAAGGDLLFLEACQELQIPCQVLLPEDEASFVRNSVLRASNGEQWRDRFYAMQQRLSLPIRVMPEELGPAPPGRNRYERANQWLLQSALSCGIARVRFLCLWNGEEGDGPGGTAHLHREVQRRTGQVTRIDTRSLPGFPTPAAAAAAEPAPAAHATPAASPILLRLRRSGPKKILTCDGGGIRGLISVGILSRLEAALRQRLQQPDLVLGDYFDLIAGTSTGGIIATCLSTGMSMEQVRGLYLNHGAAMFQPARSWWRRTLKARYRSEPLADTLQNAFNAQLNGAGPPDRRSDRLVTFGDPRLRGLLMLVLRNQNTDSPWPVCNNPLAHYNQPDHPECNLHLPLWQLVRASTAAPTFFLPEEIRFGSGGGRTQVFVDGGITTYNNPAYLAFQMATTAPYRIQWATGVDQLLIVSVGTGNAPAARPDLRARQLWLLDYAQTVPQALMNAATDGWDMVCRVLGECRHGREVDREFGSMVQPAGTATAHSNWTGSKQFAYVRYDPLTNRHGLDTLGLSDVDEEPLAAMDDVSQIPTLLRVGEAFADQHLSLDHFEGFLSPP